MCVKLIFSPYTHPNIHVRTHKSSHLEPHGNPALTYKNVYKISGGSLVILPVEIPVYRGHI